MYPTASPPPAISPPIPACCPKRPRTESSRTSRRCAPPLPAPLSISKCCRNTDFLCALPPRPPASSAHAPRLTAKSPRPPASRPRHKKCLRRNRSAIPPALASTPENAAASNPPRCHHNRKDKPQTFPQVFSISIRISPGVQPLLTISAKRRRISAPAAKNRLCRHPEERSDEGSQPCCRISSATTKSRLTQEGIPTRDAPSIT